MENILEELVKIQNMGVIEKVLLRSDQEIEQEKLHEFVTQSLVDDDADLFQLFYHQSNFKISEYVKSNIQNLCESDHMLMTTEHKELPNILSQLTDKVIQEFDTDSELKTIESKSYLVVYYCVTNLLNKINSCCV